VFESPGALLSKSLVVAGDFTCSVLVEGFEQGDFWEPFADWTSPGDITLATDTHSSAPGWPWSQLTVCPVPTPARARKKNQPNNST
jgi:hypothetical protein